MANQIHLQDDLARRLARQARDNLRAARKTRQDELIQENSDYNQKYEGSSWIVKLWLKLTDHTPVEHPKDMPRKPFWGNEWDRSLDTSDFERLVLHILGSPHGSGFYLKVSDARKLQFWAE